MNVETPCREWQGARTKFGYGQRGAGSHRRGETRLMHRWVWEQINGPIPVGMKVLHRCDNPPCFRYDHLFLGTQADNMKDMAAKGRSRGGVLNAAKTHCPQGHPYNEANTYLAPRASQRINRVCRACRREAKRKRDSE